MTENMIFLNKFLKTDIFKNKQRAFNYRWKEISIWIFGQILEKKINEEHLG